jgi:short-subunit dehydrogenase
MKRKTAIITGATKGIGKAIAYKLLVEGYDIAICARTIEDLEQLKKGWELEFPQQIIFVYAADFELQNDVQSFAQATLQQFPHIDVLVNNAGIYLPGTVLDEREGQLRQQLEINVLAADTMCKIVAPVMQHNSCGHIINICSIASLQAYGGGSSYSISKYALLGLSDNYRMALKPFGVKVSAICPGPTMSYSWEGSGVDESKLIASLSIADAVYNCLQLDANACVERMIIDNNASL